MTIIDIRQESGKHRLHYRLISFELSTNRISWLAIGRKFSTLKGTPSRVGSGSVGKVKPIVDAVHRSEVFGAGTSHDHWSMLGCVT